MSAALPATALPSVLDRGNPSILNRSETLGLLVLAAILVIAAPLLLDAFRLNLLGKYLTYAFVALGLVLCWGYCGVLSLGQGVFFGLGGYCMAMYLKLEASSPENTSIQSTPGIPDFMDWNQITELPGSGCRSTASALPFSPSSSYRLSSPSSSARPCSAGGSAASISRSSRRPSRRS